MREKRCWVVCDAGKTGTLNQCRGLAEDLGFEPEIKEIDVCFPWKLLPARWWPFPLKALKSKYSLKSPWPDLIITAGRRSVAPTAEIRRLSQGKTKVIQLQNPHVDLSWFDAVVAPAHDQLKGSNVLVTQGALHRLTQERLQAEAEKYAPLFASLPRPWVAVLIGGTSGGYRFTPGEAYNLGTQLKSLVQKDKIGVALTFSRRTEPENRKIFRKILQGIPGILIIEEQKDNPYFGLLALADFILVTCDSVSMVSEACFTGKPVYIYSLPGGSLKFQRFHQLFKEQAYTLSFQGSFEKKSPPRLDERGSLVDLLKKMLNLQ